MNPGQLCMYYNNSTISTPKTEKCLRKLDQILDRLRSRYLGEEELPQKPLIIIQRMNDAGAYKLTDSRGSVVSINDWHDVSQAVKNILNKTR